VELGHLHGSSFADLPFPKKVRAQLISAGRASVHDPLPMLGETDPSESEALESIGARR